MTVTTIRAALIVVDLQEDFCPPNGSLAVSGGRDIATSVNKLTHMPFALKIATQDWHPQDHISFASNHPGCKPFDSIIINNPLNEKESEELTLWPDHCVQGTIGANFVPEFEVSRVDLIVKKGTDKRVEMFSAFRDSFTSPTVIQSGLSDSLKQANISHVFVAGLAKDFCVKFTAIHAAMEGYNTYVVSEATSPVDSSAEATAQFVHETALNKISLATMAQVIEIMQDPTKGD